MAREYQGSEQGEVKEGRAGDLPDPGEAGPVVSGGVTLEGGRSSDLRGGWGHVSANPNGLRWRLGDSAETEGRLGLAR